MKKKSKTTVRKNGSKGKGNDEARELNAMLETMPEETRNELMRLAEESDTEDEFVRAVFVGDCPRCDSEETAMPEGPDGEEDLTVGVCNACGYVWCLECDQELAPGTPCGHWDICESCEELEDESGICGTSPGQCDIIQAWLTQRRS